MDLRLSDEQHLLLDSLREWCEQEISEEKVQQWYAEHGVPAEVQKSYVEAGFGMLGIPEKFGGVPVDTLTMGLVAEELSRRSGATMPMVGTTLLMWNLVEFGTDEQIEAALALYQEGHAPASLCISEPGAGSDNAAMTTTATTDGSSIRLNGQKTWVSNGESTPYTMVIARDAESDPAKPTFTEWFVPMDTPGITTAPLHKIGQQIFPFCEVYFDDVVLPEATALFGERHKGYVSLMKNFEIERSLICAMNVGLAQAAMDDAAAYASQRTTFGKPISSYQLIQEKLTDMEIKLRTARSMLYETFWKHDQGESIRLESALLKRYAPKVANEVASDALQIWGGLGYTTETRVGRIWVDTRGNQIAGGTDEIMVHIAGRLLAKEYAK